MFDRLIVQELELELAKDYKLALVETEINSLFF